MTFASIAQPFRSQSLSTPVRYLAGVLGSFFVAGFLSEAVCHPAEGWLGAVLYGLPMIWLIQSARTGSAENWESILWYAVWYALFGSSWVIAEALEAPLGVGVGSGELSPQTGIGVFLGSIVLVAGASRAPAWCAAAAASWRGPSGIGR